MSIFLITLGFILLAVLLMAIGVIFGKKPIAGSCGGYEALNAACAAGCKNPCAKRLAVLAKARRDARQNDDE